MLLTTEEILTHNKFWFCLDRVWIVEELEPFEDVPFHQVYYKPISRDIYYSRYPDIPKSESEDETSLTLSGFSGKYHDWKSKIFYRKYILRKRSCCSLSSWDRFNNSKSFMTKRATSLVNCYGEIQKNNNDDKVRAFFNRLLESIPPPPLEKLEKIKAVSCSLIVHQKMRTDFLKSEIPIYAEFESEKLKQTTDRQSLVPATSTYKRNHVDFESSILKGCFENYESWNDSIFGTDVMTYAKAVPEASVTNDCNYLSWSEIIDECGVNDSIARQETGASMEEILSKPAYNSYMSELTDCEDEEQGYAKFAVYKIYQTLSLGDGMTDSSSLKDFSKFGEDVNHKLKSNSSFYGQVYRITLVDDVDLVNF